MIRLKLSQFKNPLGPTITIGALFLFGIFLSVFHIVTYKTSITVAPFIHSHDYILTPSVGNLYKGQSIHGEFQAQENDLGTIELRIHNFNTEGVTSEDRILFKLKEKNAKIWYYTSVYAGGLFHELELFPFGFPIITNSKDKTYQFEITSEKGEDKNHLTLSNEMPQLVSEYQFSKHEVLSNKSLLLTLISRKVIYSFQSPLDNFYHIFIYCLPLIIYIISLSKFGKMVYNTPSSLIIIFKKTGLYDAYFKSFSIIDVIIIVAILVDILMITDYSNIIELILITSWLSYSRVLRVNNRAAFFIALFFLILSPILQMFNLTTEAEKSGLWAYLFLVLGTIQMVYHFRSKTAEK